MAPINEAHAGNGTLTVWFCKGKSQKYKYRGSKIAFAASIETIIPLLDDLLVRFFQRVKSIERNKNDPIQDS